MGFSRCEKPMFFDAFRDWIEAEKFGRMSWIKRHEDLREDPRTLLSNCRTIISLAYPYASAKPCTPDGFFTARYGEPLKNDYHNRIRKKAKRLALTLKDTYPDSKTRVCVDSAPILERSFAYRSGIGFFGKNNMLIVPGPGSYVFLAEILTTAPLAVGDAEPMEDMCGNCVRCLEACPTGALESPRRLNAARCLSYLTIEHEGELGPGTGRRMGRCFLGCDVCQEACPHNPVEKAEAPSLPHISEFLKMNEGEFKTRFGTTAFARPGLERIQRNIKAVFT
ncbi:MAG: tRNA epoxyqueuosine(34) reductase QueG [Deltaproteobacteria bacterium]|nr:tRNA epoxyqueuosine(34) reductase QueG [Deltaproteobacteria bacterium]